MKRFKELSNEPVSVREKISQYWNEIDLLKRSIETRILKFIYLLRRTPTANGKPGIHHIMARTLRT